MNHKIRNIPVITLIFIWFAASIASGLIADGRGVFRVAVALFDSTTHKPIQGAKLTLKDAGAESLNEHPELKHLLPMFSPRETGEFGDAFVYYYGGFFSETGQDGGKYRQQVRGILVIEKEGFKTLQIDLAKFIGTSFDSATSVPLVELNLETKTK